MSTVVTPQVVHLFSESANKTPTSSADVISFTPPAQLNLQCENEALRIFKALSARHPLPTIPFFQQMSRLDALNEKEEQGTPLSASEHALRQQIVDHVSEQLAERPSLQKAADNESRQTHYSSATRDEHGKTVHLEHAGMAASSTAQTAETASTASASMSSSSSAKRSNMAIRTDLFHRLVRGTLTQLLVLVRKERKLLAKYEAADLETRDRKNRIQQNEITAENREDDNLISAENNEDDNKKINEQTFEPQPVVTDQKGIIENMLDWRNRREADKFALVVFTGAAAAGTASSAAANTPAPDQYAVLGVGREASASAIRKAYHKLALKNHPDKIAIDASPDLKKEASARMSEIATAYATLGDPDMRATYDAANPEHQGEEQHSGLTATPAPSMATHKKEDQDEHGTAAKDNKAAATSHEDRDQSIFDKEDSPSDAGTSKAHSYSPSPGSIDDID
jgi:DnaJ-domain-containing protein 1